MKTTVTGYMRDFGIIYTRKEIIMQNLQIASDLTPIETYDLNLFSTYANDNHLGSEKYNQVNTKQLIEYITQTTDYKVVSYKEAIAKDSSKQAFQPHLIRLRHAKYFEPCEHEYIPELILLNSHNAKQSIQLKLGFFRFACANGIIAGNSVNCFKAKHINFDYNALTQFINKIPELAEQASEQIDKLSSKFIGDDFKRAFAFNALDIKGYWDTKTGNRALERRNTAFKMALLESMTKPKRQQDAGNDLWSIFNIVQENLIRGNRFIRPINGITKQVDINSKLWNDTLELIAA